MRTALAALAAAALVALVVIGLGQAGGEPVQGGGDFDLSRARASLEGAPPELAALHEQSAQLLDGGLAAVRDRLRELRGRPVVVNKWASWCGPCRTEFPVFQRVATELGGEVAFIGIDGKDSRDDAAAFLGEFPLPFPSYVDPDEEIAQALKIAVSYPVTLFIDEDGRTAFIHQGQYRTDEDLKADIERYLCSWSGAPGTPRSFRRRWTCGRSCSWRSRASRWWATATAATPRRPSSWPCTRTERSSAPAGC